MSGGSIGTDGPARVWVYRSWVLGELERHGIAPRPHTDPQRVAELLKELYTFRIRDLKIVRQALERHLGPQPLEAYRRQVLALKAEYPLLKVPVHLWTEEAGDGEAE